SRDTEHASGSIGPIFDKEKEQRRLQEVQLTGEIGSQAADIARAQGEIAKQKAIKDPAALTAAEAKLKAEGNNSPTAEQIADQAGRTAMAAYGTGSDLQRGIQAATAALQGLAGGDIAGALQGNSAAAGAAGAAAGELAARAIAGMLYPGVTDLSTLTEAQKQMVSTLATISAGMAGGLAGDSTASAAAGAQGGKNAVENNSLAGEQARATVKQAAESLKNQVRDKLGEGTTSSIANGIINALADTGDAALGSADYAADAVMALASCAVGDSYCNKALSDLSGKNQAVADSVAALMKSETWSAVVDTVKQAAGGNQAALEATGGMLAGIILPGKKVPEITTAQTIANSVVDAKKFDYLFGKATGNSHTLDRTNQLALEMKRLGVADDINGHAVLAEHFTQATKDSNNIVKKYTDQYGSFEIRESFFIGPSGKATVFESTFEVMKDGSHRFITTIPKNGVTK
ncbi:VENN motif pre-toxin domain-containing protein, partial [Klebsiella sp. I-Nf8]|uniref:VENN motif pre-toxin domain-containing protein n=1 Tax=Klebsiella sp. I-Nf8 TaxID=2054597 RepID=UPI00198070A3